MNRNSSSARLLDSDTLDQNYQEDMEAGSSGYETDELSGSDEDTPISCTTTPIHDTPTSTREVMMLTSTGDLHDSLAFILDMPELCDVTFLVGKQRVPVHGVKAILATRSRVLYQIILQNQRKAETEMRSKSKSKQRHATSGKLTIAVPDYRVDDFVRFLTFVHSGKVKVELQTVVGLMCASTEFGFQDLQAACHDFIRRCSGLRQKEVLLQSAWNYQHKKSAQKLICQISAVVR